MYRNYYSHFQNNERFIGPLLPFIGGALVGYVVSKPNSQFYPPYYPQYYPYPTYQYYYQYPQYTIQ